MDSFSQGFRLGLRVAPVTFFAPLIGAWRLLTAATRDVIRDAEQRAAVTEVRRTEARQ